MTDNDLNQSIQDLLIELVRIPSQSGHDSTRPIIDFIQHWLKTHSIESERLLDSQNKVVGLSITVPGYEAGPHFCLNACLDTAPVGDRARWLEDPFGAIIKDGWIYGRGAADSKAGVSIFCHLLLALSEQRCNFTGTISLLLDADEHSGQFEGVKNFVRLFPRVTGMLIGYPGLEKIYTGARGFYRAKITFYGVAEHSGKSGFAKTNAILRASAFADLLSIQDFNSIMDEKFPLPPKLTVTSIHGGTGFTSVPDKCAVEIDARLTPRFNSNSAITILKKLATAADERFGGAQRYKFEEIMTWPAYQLPDGAFLATALKNAAAAVLRTPIPTAICGPSNIGNFLHSIGIDATCGFGPRYRNLHATDESVEISSLLSAYKTYELALTQLLPGFVANKCSSDAPLHKKRPKLII